SILNHLPYPFAISFCSCVPPPAPHSFPTRRSSDLCSFIPICFNKCSTSFGKSGVGFVPWPLEPTKPVTPGVLRTTYQESSVGSRDRKSTRLNSSHVSISYAVFCLKKQTDKIITILY